MFQKLELIGDLGREPEMRYTPSGQPVTNFSIATTNSYAKDGEQIRETTWFRISVWGSHAEACKRYLSKGSRVYVEGRLVVDKETGGPRVYKKGDDFVSSFEVTASNVKFLDKKSNGEKKSEPNPYESEEEYEGFVP